MENSEQVKLYDYIDPIIALPAGTLTKRDLLVPMFRLYSQDNLDIYYAPFEYVNSHARVVFVGITPGFTQMEISYRVVIDLLHKGKLPQEGLEEVKQRASFAGSMRRNLVEMLDGIELAEALGITTTETLFGENRQFLHSTSVLRYLVFVGGENYTGHKPPLLRTAIFREFIDEYFRQEAEQLQHALFVPMGKAVSDVLQIFIDEELLKKQQCLLGFPHPSGANGHRKKQFELQREQFTTTVMAWFGR